MPRFFFDSSHAHDYRKDETGAEFSSDADALDEARLAALELAAALEKANISIRDRAIVVRDEQDRVVGSVKLSEAGPH
jgi:hypothetical protein